MNRFALITAAIASISGTVALAHDTGQTHHHGSPAETVQEAHATGTPHVHGAPAGITQVAKHGGLPKIVGEDGSIRLPKDDYRKTWSHIGSWAAVDSDSPAHGIHDVYAPQATVEAYRKTGKFPDGAILLKEVRAFKEEILTTGTVGYGGDITVTFVMVKDSTRRFEGKNVLWGDGWGWGLYEAKDPSKQAAKSYKESCQTCHIPAKDTDFVFIQGYPTLKK